jgi:excisionase family DNA binding protein
VSRDLAGVLLSTLDDDALAELAERLRPFLADAEGDPGRLLAPREAAARLGLHERTVARMAREGRLPGAVKVGRGWRFPAGSLAVTPRARPHNEAPAPRRRRPAPDGRASVRAIRGEGA